MVEPFKVKFAERCHSPVYSERQPHLRGGLLVHGDTKDQRSIVLGEGGKKSFPPMYCPPEEPKNAKKVLPEPRREDGERRGKKCLAAPDRGKGEEIKHAERVHFEEKRSISEEGLPTINWTRKRTVKMPNGIPAARNPAAGYNLEATMNRKQRVQTELDKRNNIPTATKGDKFYKEADREPGFYEKGGLVVGSTNTLKASAKPTLRKKEEGTTGSPGKKLEATYAKLQARLAEEYDLHQVHSLTVSFKLSRDQHERA